jgi:predicted DNA-binding protein YlxM (UPF0122 family)
LRSEEAYGTIQVFRHLLLDQREASEKSLSRFSDVLINRYSDTQSDELVLLQDARAAAEAAAQSKAEELKKDVIYSMHVLRYAGGKDLGGYSFGNFASSYYGKGNHLTGIQELDLYRVENKYGYAQVADPDAHAHDIHAEHEGGQNGISDDDHHDQLE